MATAVGIWIALAGALSALVGLTGLRRVRRLRRDGVQAWAAAVLQSPAGGERQLALQYTLPDGRVLEKLAAGKTAELLPGERVLISYDPADPLDAFIYGREGRAADLVFMITGTALVAFGAVIGILAP
jgi:hypothetical protein